MACALALLLVYIPMAYAERESSIRLGYSLSPAGWTNGDVTIHLTALGQSGGAGGADVYALGSSTPLSRSGGTATFTATENGTYGFEAARSDGAGSQLLKVAIENIDREPPQEPNAELTGQTGPGGAYIGACTLTAGAAQDDGSPVALFYALDGGGERKYESPLTITEPGAHRVTLIARDEAGNETATVKEFTVAGVALRKAASNPPEFIDLESSYTINEGDRLETTFGVWDDVTEAPALMLQSELTEGAGLVETFTVTIRAENSSRYDVVLIPRAHKSGQVQFQLRLGDGEHTVTRTVTVEITQQPDPPVAGNPRFTFLEDTTLEITVSSILDSCNDPDLPYGDKLSFVGIKDEPSHGTLEWKDEQAKEILIYTPNLNFDKTDQFTYTIEDTQDHEATGTVTLEAIPVNDPPVLETIENQTMDQDPDTPWPVPLAYSDPDNKQLIVTAFSSDQSIVNASGLRIDEMEKKLYITPVAGAYTDDNAPITITVQVSDGLLLAEKSFILTVLPRPVAVDDYRYIGKNAEPVTLSPLDNDRGKEIRIINIGTPSNGSAEIVDGGKGVNYTPDWDFTGQDSFTYTIWDGNERTSTANIYITVTEGAGGGQLPVAIAELNDNYKMLQDTPYNLEFSVYNKGDRDVTATPQDTDMIKDIQVENLSAEPDANGMSRFRLTITPVEGAYHADPANDSPAEVRIVVGQEPVVIVRDSGGWAHETFGVFILRANQPPYVKDQPDNVIGITIDEDATETIDLAEYITDPQGQTMRITSLGNTKECREITRADDMTVNFRPTANFCTGEKNPDGFAGFDFTVVNAGGTPLKGTVQITVNPVNDAPIASDVYRTVKENGSVEIDLWPYIDDPDLPYMYEELSMIEIPDDEIPAPSHGTLECIGAFTVK